MEFRQLQHFLVVAQELNFSKAAQKSYITQQALSKSIKILEKELGVPLFERLPRGLALTEYGSILLKHGHSIINELAETYTDIRQKKNANCQNLTIAMTAGVEDVFPLSIIFDFQKEHPEHQFSLLLNNDTVIETMLLDNKLDFAIVGAAGTCEQLEYFPLIHNDTMVIVHKDNPLSQLDSVSLEDLKNEIFLCSSSDYNVNKQLLTVCGALGFTPHICHQAAGIHFLLSLANTQQGIVLCPDHSKNAIPKSLKILRLKNDPHFYVVHIARKKGMPLNPIAEKLQRHIIRRIEGMEYNKHLSSAP
ncbi:MAG TPA: LysR family transcriptional regulator [Candidatus Eubacterium avistercoris]|uniref:LysR family transcriptional regulator n=1 Tax=Candidatus Eubacterium avistercoris TaxID=2838567 RepID=A0A9D2D0W6_9FIRM|nr:LysR family transcriptional regulator [Candidatus Eubacterium avistercoris]